MQTICLMGSPADSPPVLLPDGIGFFDSGRGGLAVWREVRARLPQADTLMIADSAYAPYGNKSEDEIYTRANLITDYLIRCRVQALVIACNTATAVAADRLRQHYPTLPIVAVEPPVKPAAKLTRTNTIAVLATARTLACDRFMRLVQAHANGVHVLTSSCPGWVELVESGALETPAAQEAVRAVIQPLLNGGADTFVLGCTHYPFLEPLIHEVAGADVQVLNPCAAVAEQLLRVLPQPHAGTGQSLFLATERKAGGHV